MKLRYDNEAVRQFCHERGVARLEIFGSALRDDFSSDSDVDLLCTLTTEKDQHCGLLEWVEHAVQVAGNFWPVSGFGQPLGH